MANPSGAVQARNEIVRASLILTNSYVAGTVIDACENYNQLNIFFKFTKGSLTDMDMKVEFSDDGVNYYEESFQVITTAEAVETRGHHTVINGGSFMIAMPINCSKIKISSLGNGTVTSSLLEVTATLTFQ